MHHKWFSSSAPPEHSTVYQHKCIFSARVHTAHARRRCRPVTPRGRSQDTCTLLPLPSTIARTIRIKHGTIRLQMDMRRRSWAPALFMRMTWMWCMGGNCSESHLALIPVHLRTVREKFTNKQTPRGFAECIYLRKESCVYCTSRARCPWHVQGSTV